VGERLFLQFALSLFVSGVCMVAFVSTLRGRLQRDRSGSAASEFALVLPLLTLLLFGVLEFGTVVYAFSAMQFGATNAARSLAVNTATEAAALASARAVLPGWVANDVSMQMAQTNAGDPNSNIIRVTLSVNASRASVVPMLTRLVDLPLTAEATIKQELPYVD
jgi:Flp pilus assembly protein TadG